MFGGLLDLNFKIPVLNDKKFFWVKYDVLKCCIDLTIWNGLRMQEMVRRWNSLMGENWKTI